MQTINIVVHYILIILRLNKYRLFITKLHSCEMTRHITQALLVFSINLLSACTTHPTTPDHTDNKFSIEKIQQLINERRFGDVIRNLNATSDHLDNKRRLFLAESYFRIAAYDKALKHFEFLLTDAGSMWVARHRSWATKLMISEQSNAVKQQIRKEMQSLQNGDNSLDLWWTLYHGYRYLHDSKGKAHAIRQLAQQALTPEAQADVAAVLLEEALQGDRQRRQALAELYLERFPDQPGSNWSQ